MFYIANRFARRLLAVAVLVIGVSSGGVDAAEPLPIWIDTDAACTSSDLANAGDCWALALALSSNQVVVRGISSVSGVIKASEAAVTATKVAERFGYTGKVYSGGARKKYRPMAASRGLAAALAKERLSIVALGPLTNIAALLVTQPKVVPQIARVIIMFGTPPEITKPDNLSDYRNYNAGADTKAVAALMRSGIEVVVVPIDVAKDVVIAPAHVESLADASTKAQWLAGVSRGWLHIWRERIKMTGAYPAEAAAVAYLTHRDLLSCRETRGLFAWKQGMFREKSGLQIGDDVKKGRPITYCGTIDAVFRDRLIETIAGGGS